MQDSDSGLSILEESRLDRNDMLADWQDMFNL